MEFKKLSDVEVVAEPTETANVLIEENGVIKKAPKTAVGGAGGGNFVVFNLNYTNNGEDWTLETELQNNIEYIANATCNMSFEEMIDLYRTNTLNFIVINTTVNNNFHNSLAFKSELYSEDFEKISFDDVDYATAIHMRYYDDYSEEENSLFYNADGISHNPPFALM